MYVCIYKLSVIPKIMYIYTKKSYSYARHVAYQWIHNVFELTAISADSSIRHENHRIFMHHCAGVIQLYPSSFTDRSNSNGLNGFDTYTMCMHLSQEYKYFMFYCMPDEGTMGSKHCTIISFTEVRQ